MTRSVPLPVRDTGAALPSLIRAAHPGPTLAVTTVAALLAVDRQLPVATVLVVSTSVLAGQLTIGWGNDLRDATRDRLSGRSDKPLATGMLPTALVTRALALAAVACVALSLAAGWRSAAAHLAVVASGHAYNLRLKTTALSWLPYAVAFGCLPAVVWLAGPDPAAPPAWMVGTGAALGVGAHFLNALPDLDDDRRTGVSGLPHRLGARRSRWAAVALLVAGSVTAALGPDGASPVVSRVALGVVLLLAGLALTTGGRTPFRAAMAIALVDVALLVVGR